jgi:ABC-type sugar transport system ATPase subunit
VTSSGEKPVVRMRAVSKSFPGVRAVQRVDFDVRAGEVHALVGENGAGKSTLIKMLAGVERPDEGAIEIDGREVSIHNADDATRLGLAFIHQDLNVVPNFSGYENMTLGLHLPKVAGVLVNWRLMRRRVREVVDRVGIDFDLRRPAKDLSQAQKQLIAIGRALLLEARVVTMDEPTAALADSEVERLYAVIRDLTAGAVGIIYTTHRLDEVFELAGRVTVLRDGLKIGTFERAELTDKRQLAELIIGREEREVFHQETPELGAVLLEARGLSWGSRVRDVSLELRGGEIVGIAGLVGSGRSELAHLLFGSLRADAGEILVHGEPVALRGPSSAIKRGIALLPEERRQQGAVPQMSVRENATLASIGRYTLGPFVHRRRERRALREMVEKLDVRVASIDAPIRNLSGGNQQKVLIGKWIDTEADVYLFDEPTQGVDVGAKAEIHRIVERLARDGAAVLFISSDLEEVVAISDRVLVMREGRLVAAMPRSEASVPKVLAHCYATAES